MLLADPDLNAYEQGWPIDLSWDIRVLNCYKPNGTRYSKFPKGEGRNKHRRKRLYIGAPPPSTLHNQYGYRSRKKREPTSISGPSRPQRAAAMRNPYLRTVMTWIPPSNQDARISPPSESSSTSSNTSSTSTSLLPSNISKCESLPVSMYQDGNQKRVRCFIGKTPQRPSKVDARPPSAPAPFASSLSHAQDDRSGAPSPISPSASQTFTAKRQELCPKAPTHELEAVIAEDSEDEIDKVQMDLEPQDDDGPSFMQCPSPSNITWTSNTRVSLNTLAR